MSLRDSLDLIRMVRPEAGTAALDHEIMSERASSLGAAEQRVVKAVTAFTTRCSAAPSEEARSDRIS